MSKRIFNQQSGIAHLGLIAIIAAVVILTGLVGYKIYHKDAAHTETATTELSTEKPDDECVIEGEDQPVQCGEYYATPEE